jgi:hypothetical protein
VLTSGKLPDRTPDHQVVEEVEIEIEVVFKEQKHLCVAPRGPAQDAPYKFSMTIERCRNRWVIELNGYVALPIGRSEILKRTLTNHIAGAAGCHVRV